MIQADILEAIAVGPVDARAIWTIANRAGTATARIARVVHGLGATLTHTSGAVLGGKAGFNTFHHCAAELGAGSCNRLTHK